MGVLNNKVKYIEDTEEGLIYYTESPLQKYNRNKIIVQMIHSNMSVGQAFGVFLLIVL